MQTYKVVFSDLSKADLQSIVTYIAHVESPTRAKHVERGILSEAKKLQHFPNGYARDEYASSDTLTVRFIVKWSYKILFVVVRDTVQVVAIFHTAQSPDKLNF